MKNYVQGYEPTVQSNLKPMLENTELCTKDFWAKLKCRNCHLIVGEDSDMSTDCLISSYLSMIQFARSLWNLHPFVRKGHYVQWVFVASLSQMYRNWSRFRLPFIDILYFIRCIQWIIIVMHARVLKVLSVVQRNRTSEVQRTFGLFKEFLHDVNTSVIATKPSFPIFLFNPHF